MDCPSLNVHEIDLFLIAETDHRQSGEFLFSTEYERDQENLLVNVCLGKCPNEPKDADVKNFPPGFLLKHALVSLKDLKVLIFIT